MKIEISWPAANRQTVRIVHNNNIQRLRNTASATDFSACALRALNEPAAAEDSFTMPSMVNDRLGGETFAEVCGGDAKTP
jgi:hypothetical protein